MLAWWQAACQQGRKAFEKGMIEPFKLFRGRNNEVYEVNEGWEAHNIWILWQAGAASL